MTTEEQADAVEGMLSGDRRCKRCRRWVKRHTSMRKYFTSSQRETCCASRIECNLAIRQQRAANQIGRKMLAEARGWSR